METTLLIESINNDCFFQVRGEDLSQLKVDEYAESMESGNKFPLIEVYQVKNVYYLADGFHRLAAMKKLGRIDVKVKLKKVSEETTLEELQVETLLNVNNHLAYSLTATQKRNVVKELLHNPTLFEKFSQTKQGRIDFVKYVQQHKNFSRNFILKIWDEESTKRESEIKNYAKRKSFELATDRELINLVINRVGLEKLKEEIDYHDLVIKEILEITKTDNVEKAMVKINKKFSNVKINWRGIQEILEKPLIKSEKEEIQQLIDKSLEYILQEKGTTEDLEYCIDYAIRESRHYNEKYDEKQTTDEFIDYLRKSSIHKCKQLKENL